jgi:hypothetical protein
MTKNIESLEASEAFFLQIFSLFRRSKTALNKNNTVREL